MFGRSQMLSQSDFAIITKLDAASGAASQRSAVLHDQPEQVSSVTVSLSLTNYRVTIF